MVAAEEITETNSFSENVLEIINDDSQSFKSDLTNSSNNADSGSVPPKEGTVSAIESPGIPLKKTSTPKFRSTTCKDYVALVVLLIGNLLNYMDRYTIAGVLNDVQDFYHISNAMTGLLQTAFLVSYMFLSPLFGYLGDRYNRKASMIFGIAFWSATTFISSFIPGNQFLLFLFLRALMGAGQASYSTIAPTLIADLFNKKERTLALSIFYIAIPVGSGLGYIVGAQVAAVAGQWQWSLRVTPFFGYICVFLMVFLVSEPKRGEADGDMSGSESPFKEDLVYLVKHKSFVTSTLGFTCVAFVTGALALWAPLYIFKSHKLNDSSATMESISFIFGVVTCLAGLIGVGSGYFLSAKFRPKYANADAIICAIGLLFASPFLFFGLLLSRSNAIFTWFLIFMAETLMCLNWALVTDILFYTIIPTRRSVAEAIQILVSHLLGDAGSPYLIGVIFDQLALAHEEQTDLNLFLSLQYALFITCFASILGSAFFFASSLFIAKDKKKMEETIGRSSMVLNVNQNSGTTLIAMTTNNSILDIPESPPLLPKNGVEILISSNHHQNGDVDHCQKTFL